MNKSHQALFNGVKVYAVQRFAAVADDAAADLAISRQSSRQDRVHSGTGLIGTHIAGFSLERERRPR